MAWWEYKHARAAGYSVFDSLASSLLNKELPSRKAEIEAEKEATIARMEALDPELVAKFRREGKL